MSVSPSSSAGRPDAPSSSVHMAPVDMSPSSSGSIASEADSHMSTACISRAQSSVDANPNSSQVTLARTHQSGQSTIISQQTPQEPPSSIRRDTGITLSATLSPSPTSTSLSPSSTMKPAMTLTSTMEKSISSRITTAQPGGTAQMPPSQTRTTRIGLIAWFQKYGLQLSMIGLAFLGLFTALAHHFYNANLNGRKVSGDAQWPPRYGSALAFFVRMVLVASVQIAYKQQAWVCQNLASYAI